ATATPIALASLKTLRPSPSNPPGYYGPADHAFALNTTSASETLDAVGELPSGVARAAFAHARIFRLGPWLLAAALGLALIDGVIALFLMGRLTGLRLPRRAPAGATTALVVLLAALPLDRPRADDAFLLKGALETHLAFAITGDSGVDEMSRAGLEGLT